MTRFEGRASGKVILLGEHVVVYGAPALAAGIERGARATVALLPPGSVSNLRLGGDLLVIDASDPARSNEADDDRVRAFAALLHAVREAPPVAVEAASELPPGGGLGSSAALGVAIGRAVTAAMDQLAGPAAGAEEALLRAIAWERVFHGNPSGIDTAAAAAGGCFRFTRADGIRPIPLACPIPLVIGSTGSASSTRTMVEGVARLRDRKPELVDRSIAGVATLVENAALALEAGDLVGLGKLMDLNQMILAGLMLSTEGIEHVCALARDAGALGAKLTGAGGGGSVIALVADEQAAAPILAAWRDAGFDGFFTHVHAAS